MAHVEQLMDRAKLQADDVARLALDAAAAGELYALPHADGRWAWRIKRWAPGQFASLSAKVISRIVGA
jgi:hypothetical protein